MIWEDLTVKSIKFIIQIPEETYNKAIDLNIDIQNVAVRSIERKIKRSYELKKLESGYKSMSKINLGFAKMCLEADEAALEITEQYLTECE